MAFAAHRQSKKAIGVIVGILIVAMLAYLVVVNWSHFQASLASALQSVRQAFAPPPTPTVEVVVPAPPEFSGRAISNARAATWLMQERFTQSGECVDLVFMADEAHKSPEGRVVNAGALHEEDIRQVIAGAAGDLYSPDLLEALRGQMHGYSGYRFVCDEAGVTLFVGLTEGNRVLLTEVVARDGGSALEHITEAEAFQDAFIDVFYSSELEQFMVYVQDGAGEPRTWRFYTVNTKEGNVDLVEACAIAVGEGDMRLYCSEEYVR